MSAESGEKAFDATTFVLIGIAGACAIFVGLCIGVVKPGLASGLALLAWPAMFHALALLETIRHGHTVPACIIGLFCGFWLFLGFGYGFSAVPAVGGAALLASMNSVLLCMEPPIAVASFYFATHYRHDRKLQRTLQLLGLTVAVLFLAKLLEASGVAWVAAKAGPATVGKLISAAFVGVLGLYVVRVIYSRLERMKMVKVMASWRDWVGYAERHSEQRLVVVNFLDSPEQPFKRSVMRRVVRQATAGFGERVLLVEIVGRRGFATAYVAGRKSVVVFRNRERTYYNGKNEVPQLVDWIRQLLEGAPDTAKPAKPA